MSFFLVFKTDVFVFRKTCLLHKTSKIVLSLFIFTIYDTGIQGVTRGCRGLQGVTEAYKGLQGVTGGYKGLQGVTVGDKGLQRVTGGSFSRSFFDTHKR